MSKQKKSFPTQQPVAATPKAKQISLEEKYAAEAFTFPDSENPRQKLLKKIFWILALITLPLVMFMSKDFGITGDETDMHQYGKDELKFYTSFGHDTTTTSKTYYIYGTPQHMFVYGGLFDITAETANKILHTKNPYTLRHALNAACGWTAMLFCGMLAAIFMGWEAGLIAFLLLLLSPGFFGQMMNNPKDIPFAAGYIAGLYFIVRFILNSPNSKRNFAVFAGVAIACAMNVRVAGMLLLIYTVMFYGLYRFSYEKFAVLGKLFKPKSAKHLLLLLAVGYFGGVLFWPFGLSNPFTHPLNALSELEKFPVKIKVLFEGNEIMSGQLPWYYPLKWISISIPLTVLFASLIYFGAAYFFKLSPARKLMLIVPAFGAAFPLFYAIYKKSNVYDGWRHFIFIYPCMVVMAALVWTWAIKQPKKIISYVALGVLILYSGMTMAWMVKNHPNETVYFNELEGGVKKAYGNFETDYYMNSIKPCADWLKKNVLENSKDTLTIGSNVIKPMIEYLDGYKVKNGYLKQGVLSSKNWDYAVLYSRFFDKVSIDKKLWMPKGVVFTVEADGVPLACVVKRISKDDFYANEMLKQHNVDSAMVLFRKYMTVDSMNQEVVGSYVNCLLQKNQIKEATVMNEKLLSINPSSMDGLTTKLRIQIATGDGNGATATAQQIIATGPEDYNTYMIVAQTYHEMNDDKSAYYYQQQGMPYAPKEDETP